MRIPGMEQLRRQSRHVGVICLAVAASAVVAGQDKPPHPPIPSERLADSYQIYSLLMPGQVFTDMDSGQSWAISDTTVNYDDMDPKLAPDATLQAPPDNRRAFREALSDYYQRKEERYSLMRRYFQLGRPYLLLKPDDAAQLRAAKSSMEASSDQQSEYKDYLGITYFSEVYFNTQQTAALVYILDWCGNLCSQSEWVYLEKQNGVWVRRSGKAPPQT
jgi:hypothetical protein